VFLLAGLAVNKIVLFLLFATASLLFLSLFGTERKEQSTSPK
jgi:hypothetical protein